MKLYYFPGATCALKARLAAVEKGAPVEQVEVTPEERAGAAYRAIHPKGLVPALTDGDLALPESTTIMRYLDEACDGPALQPADPRARAVMNNWLKRFDEELFAAIGYLTIGLVMRDNLLAMPRDQLEARLAGTSPNSAVAMLRLDAIDHGPASAAVAHGFRTVDAMLGDMESALAEQSWLAGETYSLADIAYTAGMIRFDELAFAPLWQGRPNLAGWWNRVRARPSYAAIALGRPNPLAPAMREAGQAALETLMGKLAA